MVIHFLLFLSLASCYCEDVVSIEIENVNKERKDKHLANSDNGRRFNEDLDDKDWHISHLRDTNFFNTRKSGCADDTLEEKINKYKRMLKNDPALVEYVHADPLPFNESDLIGTCPVPKSFNDLLAKENNTQDLSKTAETKEVKEPITRELNASTTGTLNEALNKSDKVENGKAESEIRRAGDYLFSSIEYYDEVVDFDESLCPHAVQVINLEIDELRNYDIKCETIIEWRSLE